MLRSSKSSKASLPRTRRSRRPSTSTTLSRRSWGMWRRHGIILWSQLLLDSVLTRLHPSVPQTPRFCNKQLTLPDGTTVPAGTVVCLSQLSFWRGVEWSIFFRSYIGSISFTGCPRFGTSHSHSILVTSLGHRILGVLTSYSLAFIDRWNDPNVLKHKFQYVPFHAGPQRCTLSLPSWYQLLLTLQDCQAWASSWRWRRRRHLLPWSRNVIDSWLMRATRSMAT